MDARAREERVKELEALVDSGEYNVDSVHIANAILTHERPIDINDDTYGADESDCVAEEVSRVDSLAKSILYLIVAIGVAVAVTVVVSHLA